MSRKANESHCRKDAEPHVHRLQTLSNGGDSSRDNMVAVCADCHPRLEFVAATGADRCLACDRSMTDGNAGCLHYLEASTGSLSRGYVSRWLLQRRAHDGPGACHDCGAAPGACHHYGCDLELCPVCGEQLIVDRHAACGLEHDQRALEYVHVVYGPVGRR